VIAQAVEIVAGSLATSALTVGVSKIGERKYMQPALKEALTNRLGSVVVEGEPHLRFEHWQGLTGKKLGGIDIAIRRDDDSGYRSFLELKWGDPDWMILDFYKMATGRVSPGADACYLVAGQRSGDWEKCGSVCELFRTHRWRTENVLRRHYKAFRGDESEYGKLTSLPTFIDSTLVADVTLSAPLDTWAIKAIRVEPNPLADDRWHKIRNGEVVVE
jgi:hypothetical protein